MTKIRGSNRGSNRFPKSFSLSAESYFQTFWDHVFVGVVPEFATVTTPRALSR